MKKTLFAALTAILVGCGSTSDMVQAPDEVARPAVIPHSEWEAHPPRGHEARGVRRNLAPGDSLVFGPLTIHLIEMSRAKGDGAPDTVAVLLVNGTSQEVRHVPERAAFNWNDYHVAVLAAHTSDDELGAGKTEIEVGIVTDLPVDVAKSQRAGDATMRLRIKHDIRMITLHHSGSAEPLRPEDDVAKKIRDLQLWSESDRNWWDVPYHFLIGLDGIIYEGRDHRYRGETNTRYDVDGHLLISVLGNYDIQESTKEQIEAITNLMAWAVGKFDIPLDRIYGHSDLAATSCPGTHLRKYLDDGTIRNGIRSRLASARQ